MKKVSIITAFLICLFGLELVKSAQIQENLQKNLIRLHIIANSNSDVDQRIKLDVRNGLLGSESYDLKGLNKKANEILKEEKAEYGAKVCFRDRYVPKKVYKNIALPEGEYACIDVILGSGEGENWWCVAYPPLCFTESVTGELSDEAKRQLELRLSKESLKTILKGEKVTYKFKIVEDFQKILKILQ